MFWTFRVFRNTLNKVTVYFNFLQLGKPLDVARHIALLLYNLCVYVFQCMFFQLLDIIFNYLLCFNFFRIFILSCHKMEFKITEI